MWYKAEVPKSNAKEIRWLGAEPKYKATGFGDVNGNGPSTVGRPGHDETAHKVAKPATAATHVTLRKNTKSDDMAAQSLRASLTGKFTQTYVPIFQTALFYSIANQLTNTFISNKPDSAIALMICIAIYLFIILVAEVWLQMYSEKTNNKDILSFGRTFTLYMLGLMARLLTQLESTLAARFAFDIFDEASNVSWAIAVGFVTATLFFLARLVAGA